MTAAAGLRLRVTVGDGWTPVRLDAVPEETIAVLKGRALAAVHIAAERAGTFEVKFGGAGVRDESRTLGALGVPDGAALVVLPRRRRPVR